MNDLVHKETNRNYVLIAGIIIQFCAGIIYMWSVFKVPVEEHLNGWDTALTASIMLSAFVIGILVGGHALDKYGPRIVCIVGSIMMSMGIFSTSFVTSDMPDLIYLTYGVIGGFGVGVVYASTVSVIQKWFFDKRGFATGMMVGAFGFSLVFFTPVANYLLDSVGVPETFQIFGMVFLILCVIASLFIIHPPSDYSVGTGSKVNIRLAQKQYKPSEILRTKTFYFIMLSLFFVLPAYFILNPMFVELGEARGLSKDFALVAVMITGVCSALGRLGVAWISDKIGRINAVFGVILITLIGVLMITFAEGALFVVCLALISFAFGGAAGVYPSLVVDNFGTENIGANYGLVMLGFGGSALLFPVIAAGLTSTTMPFLLAAVTCLIALVCIVLLRAQKQPNAE